MIEGLSRRGLERVCSKALDDVVKNECLGESAALIRAESTEAEETKEELDKWTHVAIDTVTAVAISHDFIAWASKRDHSKYGVFLRERNSLKVPLDKDELLPFSFETNGIIQDLDFTRTKLIGVDFQNWLYILPLVGSTLPEAFLTIQKIKIPNREGYPTSVTVFEKLSHELIAVGTSFGKILVFAIFEKKESKDDSNQIELMNVYPHQISSSAVLGAHFLAKCDCDNTNEEGELSYHVHMILAEKSGFLRVYNIAVKTKENSITASKDFEQKLNLQIEYGEAIASSSSGDRFVIGCGDRKVRVFQKVSRKNGICRNFFVDEVSKFISKMCSFRFLQRNGYERLEVEVNQSSSHGKILWELSQVFDLSAAPLAVSLSCDGERVAVGKEDAQCDVFDMKSGCKIRSFDHGNRVRSVDLDSNGKFLIAGDFNFEVNLFNIEAGFNKPQHPFLSQNFGTIQSVTLDAEGKMIGIGTEAGYALVYEVKNSQFNAVLFEVKKQHRVYVVKLSGDGQIFAYGGYDSQATFVKMSLEKKIDDRNFVHDSSDSANNSNFIWGLDIKENENMYVAAVGSWDCVAYVYFLKKETLVELHPRMCFKQDDRVFDVVMSEKASLLLVGGRDMKARLYKIPVQERKKNAKEKETVKIIPSHVFHDEDRIYCVAISPRGDYIAYGGIRKQVHVYQIVGKKSIAVQKFTHQHTVHRLSFMDNGHLAAVSEDGCCALYKVDSTKPVLHLNLDEGHGSGAGNSLAFSSPNKGLLAIAHGCAVTIYGNEFGYGPFDRPSFEVATDLLDRPEALNIALESHPTLTNAFSSERKKSLLSVAVESGYSVAVDLLLNSQVPSGLFIFERKDQRNQTANSMTASPLTSALRMRNRNMMAKLLQAISSQKIVNSEHMFLVGLFSAYWDYTIQKNANASGQINQIAESKASSAFLRLKMPSGRYTDVEFEQNNNKKIVGSVFKAIALYFPSNFLEFMSGFELEECDPEMLGMIESAQLENAVRVALPFKTPKNFWHLYLEGMEKEVNEHSSLRTLLSRRLPHNVLHAQRIPIPGIYESRNIESTLENPLEVIINAASTLQQYSVFDKNTIVHDLVMFYWDIYGPKFLVRTCLYLVYYCCCVYLSTQIATYQDKETYTVAIFFCFALICMGIYGLSIEVKQFRMEIDLEGQRQNLENSSTDMFLLCKNSLVRHFDIWNTLDFFAYSTQLITNVMFLAATFGHSSYLLLGFEAVSILLLTWKWFYYARAFSAYGAFVRMIQRVILDMGNFLGFMMFWILGFALSFHVLLGNNEKLTFQTIPQSLWTVLNMVYGDIGDFFSSAEEGFTLYYLLFQIMMLSSVVTMLNLLVAILNDTYQKVNGNVHAESTFQLASIILELVKARDLDEAAASAKTEPKWVHILAPKPLANSK